MSGPGGLADSHFCPSYLPFGFLQCNLNEGVFEDHLEAATVSECNGTVVWSALQFF